MKFIFLQTKCRLTIIIREAHAQMSFLDLLQEDVLLVEEEYNGCGSEVTVVTDTVEQVETLMHSVLWLEGHGKRFVTKMPHSNSACKMFGWSFIDGPQWQPTTSSSSTSTMSYALRAAMKMIQVTPSKQWIHFFLSERWPPTSNILQNTKISLLALVSIQTYLIQFFWLLNLLGILRWWWWSLVCLLHAIAIIEKAEGVPEVEVLERELGLDDTGGLHSWSQDVLLSRDIARLDQPLQVIQIAWR